MPFSDRIVSILAILAAVLALCGCLSKPPLHKQTFTFGAPPTASGGAVAGDRVLGIRSPANRPAIRWAVAGLSHGRVFLRA